VSALLACLLAAPLLFQDAPSPNGESFELFRGLEASGRIHIRVPNGPCEDAARKLAGKVRGPYEISLDPSEPDPLAVRFLVGAPTDPELLPCVQACGIEVLVGGFRVLGREYTRPGDALMAVIEDPLHAGRPLCFVVGNDRELGAAYLDGIPRLSRPHLWVHADGELALECPLAPDGRPRAEEATDYQARRAEYFEGHANDAGHILVHARKSLDKDRWRTYGLALTRVERKVADWFGEKEPPEVEMFLYDHLEDFERCLGTSALSGNRRAARRRLAPGMPDDGGAGLARVLGGDARGRAEWLRNLAWRGGGGDLLAAPARRVVQHLIAGKLLPAVDARLFLADGDCVSASTCSSRAGCSSAVVEAAAPRARPLEGAAIASSSSAPCTRTRIAPGSGQRRPAGTEGHDNPKEEREGCPQAQGAREEGGRRWRANGGDEQR
jgi:hypothetical protein